MSRSSGRGGKSPQVQLPGDAEAVGEPGELRAEPIVGWRHQHGPTLRKRAERPVELGLVHAIDKQGHRWGEREGVLDRAVDAGQLVTREKELRPLDRAFLA